MRARLLVAAVALAAAGGQQLAVPPTAESAVRARPAPSWSVDGVVRVTKVVGDTVLVGGRFRAAVSPDGTRVPVHNVAAFGLEDGRLRPWRADTDGVVRALAVRGDAVWIAGYFSEVGGVQRRGVAKVDLGSGAVDRAFDARLSGGAQALALHRRSLFVGGAFLRAGGERRPRLAEVDALTGTVDRRFRPRVRGTVLTLAVDPSRARLWVGGSFRVVGGKRRPGVAAVARGSGVVRGPRLWGVCRRVLDLDLAPDGRTIFVGAGCDNRLSAVRTSDGARRWQRRAEGDIQAVRLAGRWVYFGFHDGFGADRGAKVLRAEATTGRVQAWRPRIPAFWGVRSIDVSRRWVVIGGDMDRVSGVRARGWARFRR